MSEIRGRRSEVGGGQMSGEDRGRMSEIGGQRGNRRQYAVGSMQEKVKYLKAKRV
jgi:hypothetical protein